MADLQLTKKQNALYALVVVIAITFAVLVQFLK